MHPFKIYNKAAPYGTCVENATPMTECELICDTKTMVENCGCHLPHMNPYRNGTLGMHATF